MINPKDKFHCQRQLNSKRKTNKTVLSDSGDHCQQTITVPHRLKVCRVALNDLDSTSVVVLKDFRTTVSVVVFDEGGFLLTNRFETYTSLQASIV
jgi:hypothetical protein